MTCLDGIIAFLAYLKDHGPRRSSLAITIDSAVYVICEMVCSHIGDFTLAQFPDLRPNVV